jgi:tetratricopeptide (TPR) repeat protein
VVRRRDVFDLMARLVDKSLVVVDDRGRATRYRMLETIREYALERLDAEGAADDVARRHAELFFALAEKAEPKLHETPQAEWFGTLEDEHDNLRAALAWLLEHETEDFVRLTVAVSNLWRLHGHLREGRRWLEAALARADAAPASVRAGALLATGGLAQQQGDLGAARTYTEACWRIALEAGDARQIAWSSYSLGLIGLGEGDLDAARARFEDSLARAREVGPDHLIAGSLNSLGEVARLQGNGTEARELYERAETLWRRTGNRYGLSISLVNLGALRCEQGDLPAASACFHEAIAHAGAVGSTVDLSLSLDGLGALAAKRGAWERAATLAAAAEALRDGIGYEIERADRAFRERYMAEVREQLGPAALSRASAAGRALTPHEAIRVADEAPDP